MGKTPKDNTLRIAPTFIDEKELEVAMDVFITAVQIAHKKLDLIFCFFVRQIA
jgi:hypothetical protein